MTFRYFTKQESIDIDLMLNQLDQAVVANLLHHNGQEGKVGSQWKTDRLEDLITGFTRHAFRIANLDPHDDDYERELVDAASYAAMLFDRRQMYKRERDGETEHPR